MKRIIFLLILVLLCGVFVFGTINKYTPSINEYLFGKNYTKLTGNVILDPYLEPPYYFMNGVGVYEGKFAYNANRVREAIKNGSFVEGVSFAILENSQNPMLDGGNYAYMKLDEDYLNGKKKDPFYLNVEKGTTWRVRTDDGGIKEVDIPGEIKVVYTPEMSENVKAYVERLEAYAQKIRESGEVLLDGQTYGSALVPDEHYDQLHRDLIERLGLGVEEADSHYVLTINEDNLKRVVNFEKRSPISSGYAPFEGENWNKIELSKLLGNKDRVFKAYIGYLSKLFESIGKYNRGLFKKILENAPYVAYREKGKIHRIDVKNLDDFKRAILILGYGFYAKKVCEDVEGGEKFDKAIIYNFAHNFVNAGGFSLNNQLHGAKLNFDLLKENAKDYIATGKMKTTMIKYGQLVFIFEPNRVAIQCSASPSASNVIFDKTYDKSIVNTALELFTEDSEPYKAAKQMLKDKKWIEKFYRSLSNEETRNQFEVYWFKQEDSGFRAPPEQGLDDDGQATQTTYSPLIKSADSEAGGMYMLVMKWVDPDTNETHVHLISTYRMWNAGDQVMRDLTPIPGSPLVPFERELVIPKGWKVEDIAVDVVDPDDKDNYITVSAYIKIYNEEKKLYKHIFYDWNINIDGSGRGDDITIFN